MAHASAADGQAGSELMGEWFKFLRTLRELEEQAKRRQALAAAERQAGNARGPGNQQEAEAAPLAAKRSAPLAGKPQEAKCVMGGLKRQASTAPRRAAMMKRGPQVSRTMMAKPRAAAPGMKLGK